MTTTFRHLLLTMTAVGSLSIAAPLAAQDKMENIVKARQGSMQVLALNLGILGGMAKGAIPYDAGAATSAASDIAAIAGLDTATYWPEGSDADSTFDTSAKATIWAEGSDFFTVYEQMDSASIALLEVAGNGEDAMKAAFGTVGQACGTCHKAHRAKAN